MIFFKKLSILLLVGFTIGLTVLLLYPAGKLFVVNARGVERSDRVEYGKEVIYSAMGRGDIKIADQILENEYELSRFQSAHIDPITWTEDPYVDPYWRFNFYNLEPVRHLTYAWLKTGDTKYRDKSIEITESFIDSGMNGLYSWDKHGSAMRTMTLVNLWVQIIKSDAVKHGDVSRDFMLKLAQALEVHGAFLADEANYEGDYNHGLDQAVALFLLSVNIPQLSDFAVWHALSVKRINEVVAAIVDADGILVENAPYYHFYVLDKLWDINTYLTEYEMHKEVPALEEKIEQMVAYGTYILQPDLHIPTIGASLGESVQPQGFYREIAEQDPRFRFVLTKAAEGKRPRDLNVFYPEAGQTIMRSGWGNEETFEQQTQLIFDVGSFRTNHSDYDALSFHLYSDGLALMPDSGLYGYEGPYRTYFQGTRAHNTVVVDGTDQMAAELLPGTTAKIQDGTFEEGDGYVYQSGAHSLYQDVVHKRAIALIEDSTVVIVDSLDSSERHDYEQMFHLAPGAEITTDDLTLRATWETGQSLTIRQYMPLDMTLSTAIDEHDPPNGVCTTQYGTTTPCYAVSYKRSGESVSFVTVITIGDEEPRVSLPLAGKYIRVVNDDASYLMHVEGTEGVRRTIDADKKVSYEQLYEVLEPIEVLNTLGTWRHEIGSGGYRPGSVRFDPVEVALEISAPSDGSAVFLSQPLEIDLENKRLYFKTKVKNSTSIDDLVIFLSNDNWTKTASYDLRNQVYNIDGIDRSDVWYQYALGETALRDRDFGAWEFSDPSFDWSAIDQVRLEAEANYGEGALVGFKDFAVTPEQSEPRVVLVFDDGDHSVWDAAELMHTYNMKGVIPVVTGSIDRKNYLTLEQLKILQNDYGWDIANHTTYHKNATEVYVPTGDFKGFEADMTDALEYLIRNDINSAPNWFVYPHGTTDKTTKEIVKEYYTFARSTVDGAEMFPFPEPHDVKTLSIYDGEANNNDVINVLADAYEFNQTVFLMFHRFSKGKPSVFTEWQLSEFEEILKFIGERDMSVLTLSELDALNGMEETSFTLTEEVYPQIVFDVTVDKENPFLAFFSEWREN